MERRHNTRHAAALAAAAAIAASSSYSPERSDVRKEEEVPLNVNSDSPVLGKIIMNKGEMYENFKSWAMKTYGDSAKTKTVTRKKYTRIIKILKGEEHSNAENSKFRFWVKAKGFRIGPPPTQRIEGGRSDHHLYVPCNKVSPGTGKEETVYKKVAVVENFFDIIYEVHVDMDTRGGKHAGQKRTYKTIAETYAFLPREAVTHFLMSCVDCQKRMHVGVDSGGKSGSHGNKEHGASSGNTSPESVSSARGDSSATHLTTDIDYSLPITTTYLKRMRSLGYSEEEALNFDGEEVPSNIESESSEHEAGGMLPIEEEGNYPMITDANDGMNENKKKGLSQHPSGTCPTDVPLDMSGQKRENGHVRWSQEEPINMIKVIDTKDSEQKDRPLLQLASSKSVGAMRETSETPDGTKDEEDDDEEDDADKIDANAYDPERLKAFNMFVRLFVDENLDRMVPISRQPKDKIQAIIDSCSRQFPEFSDRARKRIRTYLKSCRRTKRARDYNGWDLDRSTPHLSSPLAEQILSVACDNESHNAKRMRLGLKPISVSLTEIERSRVLPHSTSMTSHYGVEGEMSRGAGGLISRNSFVHPLESQSQLHAQLTKPIQHSQLLANRNAPASKTTQSSIASTRIKIINDGTCGVQQSTNSLLPSSTTYREMSQFHIPVSDTSSSHSNNNHQVTTACGVLTNGPTDLSVKKPPLPRYSLNPSEANAVKQLIAGYRESAAFLLRSADELEQLLMQQN
ncbi:nucleolar protein 4-like [Limulus polyphemus]|uniref:Nucleolar protein 4-like n=1 Tax=Limulus polyphemus TaxID=6850 RepID=A0ABM1BDL8_LIMPO|nr:nucleolar protein 4-like [Limulus polyphemus]